MLHHDHMGGPLITIARSSATGNPSTEFGLGLRHHFYYAAWTFYRRKPLGLKSRDKNLIRRRLTHGFGGDDGDLAFHPRIEKEIAIGNLGHGFDHRLYIRVLKIEQHFTGAQGRGRGRRGGATLGRGRWRHGRSGWKWRTLNRLLPRRWRWGGWWGLRLKIGIFIGHRLCLRP